MVKSPVNITQVMRVDLEGDGRDEVLIAARNKDFSPIVYKANDYSLILLRKLAGKQVKSYLLQSEFHNRDRKNGSPEYCDIAGFWDVNGDGVLEIGIRWNCQRADAGGLALYSVDKDRVRLLAKDGMGN